MISSPSLRQKLHYLDDLLLAGGIFLFAAAVPLLLRLKFSRLESLLSGRRTRSVANPAKIQQIVNYTDSILRLGRPLIQRGCLTRGLTLYYFLRRAGLNVELCFGLAHQRRDAIGHCWLVLDGQPFLERDSPTGFAEVYRFSRDPHPIGLR